MIKRILVGLDGSPFGNSAVEHAAALAREHGAAVSGIAVVDSGEIRKHAAGAGLGASWYAGHLEQALTEHHMKRTHAITERFAADMKEARLPYKVLHTEGLPIDAILGEAAYHDLVVVGRRTFFRDGETPDSIQALLALAATATCPVLAVPEASKKVKRVIVGISGSSSVARTVQHYLDQQPWGHAELVLLHQSDDASRGGAIMNGFVDYIASRGLKAEPVLTAGKRKPGEALLEEAKARKCDAFVIGAHDRTALGELIFGSNTRQILENAQGPVYLHG